MSQFVKIKFINKSNLFKKIKGFFKHKNPIKYAKYRYEWENTPKQESTRSFPIHLGIEPTNACNLNCVFCARRNIDYRFGYMNFELYKKIIDEGSINGLRSVKLVRGGESLLHPRFVEMVKYAKDKGVLDVMFNTNGMLLTEEKSKEIIDAGLDLIIFSVDAPDREIYERQRVGSNYDLVEKNVKRFIELKNKMNPKLKTRAHMVYTDETEHLIDKHIERWKGFVDETTVNRALEYREELCNKKFKCRTPFRRLDITWDGDVYACDPDFDPKGRLLIGNANSQTIFELWHSPKMRAIREAFRNESPHLLDPCKYCSGA
ncbi:radical SAM protein [Patescibacteria group bacterium]|nr:radical SAM protein [Patescibacteria group bacterium]